MQKQCPIQMIPVMYDIRYVNVCLHVDLQTQSCGYAYTYVEALAYVCCPFALCNTVSTG